MVVLGQVKSAGGSQFGVNGFEAPGLEQGFAAGYGYRSLGLTAAVNAAAVNVPTELLST